MSSQSSPRRSFPLRQLAWGKVALLVALPFAWNCRTTEYAGRVVTPEWETEIRAQHPISDLVVAVDRDRAPRLRGRIVHVGPVESLIESRGEEQRIDNRKIAQISVKGHLLGALEGLGLGVLGGAAGGAALAAVGCPNGEKGCFEVDKGGAVVISGVAGAVIGAVVGGLVGGALGDRTTYWFE